MKARLGPKWRVTWVRIKSLDMYRLCHVKSSLKLNINLPLCDGKNDLQGANRLASVKTSKLPCTQLFSLTSSSRVSQLSRVSLFFNLK